MFRRYVVLCVLSVTIYIVLLAQIVYLYHENSTLKARITTCRLMLSNLNEAKDIQSSNPKEAREIQPLLPSSTNKPLITKTSKVAKTPREFMESDVTFILFQPDGFTPNNGRLRDLRKRFPSSPFVWNKNNSRLGKSFNRMISQVKTEYFLFLEPRASPSKRRQESIASLWNALEQFPELDFVGGSYLSGDKLTVPCHRYRLCRWTFSESYEYERFLDNVMICDGISSSFMGRTDSVKKVKEGFDADISDLLVLKDFFLRAKTNSTVVGTRPNVFFHIDQFESLYQLWNAQDITKELVSFALKHKVFNFKDIDGNVIELCNPTSPLSGKGVCIEQNSHQLMLDGGHWAYKGLFAYPIMWEYLKISLLEVTDFLNQHNVSYSVIGGVGLGAIKMRSVLPWDSGDVDFYVNDLSVDEIYDLLKPLANQKGYVVRHRKDQVHVFCTPKDVGDLSGGLATFHPTYTKAPPSSEFIKMKTNGKWITYKRTLVFDLINYYGKGYLGHALHGSRETMECKIKGHNACMPNFKSFLQGKGGTAREYFCEI